MIILASADRRFVQPLQSGRPGLLPANIIPFLVLVAALMLVADVALRRLAPQADPVLLPLAALLNGCGYVFIAGLNSAEASAQATWTLVAVIAFVGTLALFPRAVTLERYRYSFAFVGVGLLVLPLVPHIGEDVNGARLWVHFGPLNFQPEEFAKLALAIFFASVLAERADLLATGTRRIGRWLVLEPRYMAPLLGALGRFVTDPPGRKRPGIPVPFLRPLRRPALGSHREMGLSGARRRPVHGRCRDRPTNERLVGG